MSGGWRTVSVNRALLTSHIRSCTVSGLRPHDLLTPRSPSPAADSSPFSSLHCEHIRPNKSTLERSWAVSCGTTPLVLWCFLNDDLRNTEINDWRETSSSLFCPSVPRRPHTYDTWSHLVKLTWHYYGIKSNTSSLLSLSLSPAADMSPFSIIHTAFFDPRCQLSQKHISGFYRHFYRHTWKLPYKKGHKLKYYECCKSARHLSASPNERQPCCIFIII